MLRHEVFVGGKEMLENLGKNSFYYVLAWGNDFRLLLGKVAWCMLHGAIKASQAHLEFWLGVMVGSFSNRDRETLKCPHE